MSLDITQNTNGMYGTPSMAYNITHAITRAIVFDKIYIMTNLNSTTKE
jgi:hypothetical protein